MFAKATRNFLRDIDVGGELIPVSSLNDSYKAQLLSVVEKKKRFWCWQKPKYHFSSCACLLGDVLTEEKLVKPVVVESEFVKYEGTFGDVLRGNIDADFGAFHGNAASSGRVETKSTFGTLRKQEVDMQHLMKDILNCKINLHHPVIQQLHENRNDVLCILKEKIITTQKCIISEHTQTEERIGGKVGLKTKMVKVSVTENGNFSKDENTVLEIPAPTAIAYSVVELLVKRNGHFEFCLLSEKQGGFEKEIVEKHQPLLRHTASLNAWDVVDGFQMPVQSSVSLSVLKKDILELTKHFSILQELPETQRAELYYWLFEILGDEQTVSRLQAMVEEVFSGKRPGLPLLDELQSPDRERIQKILYLTGYDIPNQKLIEPFKKELLVAIHVLISALDEMPDTALPLLGACCKLHLLPALCALMMLKRRYDYADTMALKRNIAAKVLARCHRLFNQRHSVRQLQKVWSDIKRRRMALLREIWSKSLSRQHDLHFLIRPLHRRQRRQQPTHQQAQEVLTGNTAYSGSQQPCVLEAADYADHDGEQMVSIPASEEQVPAAGGFIQEHPLHGNLGNSAIQPQLFPLDLTVNNPEMLMPHGLRFQDTLVSSPSDHPQLPPMDQLVSTVLHLCKIVQNNNDMLHAILQRLP